MIDFPWADLEGGMVTVLFLLASLSLAVSYLRRGGDSDSGAGSRGE